MSEIHLSEAQRLNMASRVLSDAELISRGAQITETGRLALVGSQLEYVTLAASAYTDLSRPIMDESDPPPHPMDTWLDTGLDVAWAQMIGSGTAYNRFLRAGFHSLRDVVTAGRRSVSDTPYAGNVWIGKLEQIITANPYGLIWEAMPTPEQNASICTRLSQVHAGALGLGQSRKKNSVLDVLKTPLLKRPAMLTGRDYVTPITYAETSNLPEVYAIRFERERLKIEYDQAPQSD